MAFESWKERAEELEAEVYALYLAFRDGRTPLAAKAVIALLVAYAVSPVDPIPDFIPGLGYLDELVVFLRDRYGDDLRWVANYNSQTYDYRIHHVRDDLTTELTGNQLDYVIHRSLAVFNKRHSEEVYFHLGESDYLVVHYERGTALHVFLDDERGVTVMLEPEVPFTLPDLVSDCRAHIEPA